MATPHFPQALIAAIITATKQGIADGLSDDTISNGMAGYAAHYGVSTREIGDYIRAQRILLSTAPPPSPQVSIPHPPVSPPPAPVAATPAPQAAQQQAQAPPAPQVVVVPVPAPPPLGTMPPTPATFAQLYANQPRYQQYAAFAAHMAQPPPAPPPPPRPPGAATTPPPVPPPAPSGWHAAAGGAVGGASGGIGSKIGGGVGGAFGGGPGALAGAFIGGAAEHLMRMVTLLPKRLHDFAEETAAATRRLSLFDAQIGLASAQLTLGDFNRNLALARFTAPTGAELLRAVNRMRDEFIPFQAVLTNLRQEAAIGGASFLGGAAGTLGIVPEIGQAILKAIDPNGGGIAGVAQAVGQQFATSLLGALLGGPVGALAGAFLPPALVDKFRQMLKDLGIIPDLKVGGGAKGAWDNFTRDVAAGAVHPGTPIHGGFLIQPFNGMPGRRVMLGDPNWVNNWFPGP